MATVDRREFLGKSLGAALAADVLVTEMMRNGIRVAEAAPLNYHPRSISHGGIEYARAFRFPDSPVYHPAEGVISNPENRGKGLETWMGANGRDLSSLSHVPLESLGRSGDVYVLPPNQMVTLVDSGGEWVGPQQYTRPQRFKIEAGHVLFIAAGEGNIDLKSDTVDSRYELIQIDGNIAKGEKPNPHQNHVYIPCYEDPEITLSRFVSKHAILIMAKMDSPQIVAEQAVYRRRGLAPNWRTTAEHYLDLRGGRFGSWIGNRDSNTLEVMDKNY